MTSPDIQAIREQVSQALIEDLGGELNAAKDITANLIDADTQATATIITREPCVVCGVAWVNQAFALVDPNVSVTWHVNDGDKVDGDTVLVSLSGSARAILTAERTALNFLQTLSGTATTTAFYAHILSDSETKILDTRKTLPGLRMAQKYAVRCGGCHNHRIGLYDAFLIKENHITACGSIAAAVTVARHYAPGKPVEVEVENLSEFEEALAAACDRVMLDNFPLEHIVQAVSLASGRVELEASGNVTAATLLGIAQTGVDFISIGALTKDCKALDLSMRLL